jgi:sec-independent protein translocase protein TatA
MPSIGPLEIIIVLVIVLLIFGPKRLPDLGRSLGRGMREFKDSVTGKDDDREELSTRAEASEGGAEPRSGPAGGNSDADSTGPASPTTAGQKQA